MHCFVSVTTRIIGLALLLVLASPKASSQDFTGLWSGFIYVLGNQLPYELAITKTDDKLEAYSLIIFTIDGVENTGIKLMNVKAKKTKLSIEDDELVYDNYSTAAKKLTLYSTLSLEKEDSVWILSGSFFTRSADRSSFKGTIRLQKQENMLISKLAFHLERMDLLRQTSFASNKPQNENEKTGPVSSTDQTSVQEPLPAHETRIKQVSKSEITLVPTQKKEIIPGVLPTVTGAKPMVAPGKLVAAEINNRKTEVIRNVFFHSDSLILSLYDNGEVDGDTISVVINNEIFIARQGLIATPSITTYYFKEATVDTLTLIMYAENLGRIPPNTGVLIIQDGNERYHVRFEGDYQKNSAVILRRRR